MIILFKLHAAAQPDSYPHFPEAASQPDIWFNPCGEPGTEAFEPEQLLKVVHLADALGTATFAKIVGPHLSYADLSNADLSCAVLVAANLSHADLSYASLFRVFFDSTNLDSAHLSHAYLSYASISNANLSNANLSNAILDSANLDSAILSNTSLDSANLSNATLDSAILSYANLSNTFLDSAILLETNLRNTKHLTSNQLGGNNSPLICNASLPPDLTIDPNRDWGRLATALYQRYSHSFGSLEKAEKWVEARRSC